LSFFRAVGSSSRIASGWSVLDGGMPSGPPNPISARVSCGDRCRTPDFSPVGPFRLDIGFPLDRRPGLDDRFQVYVSLDRPFKPMNWRDQIRMEAGLSLSPPSPFSPLSHPLGLVQTDWGIRELAGWVSSLHGELTFGPTVSPDFFRFVLKCHRLTVQDRQGIWMEAGGLEVHWSPRHLTRGQIYFKGTRPNLSEFRAAPHIEEGEERTISFVDPRLAVGSLHHRSSNHRQKNCWGNRCPQA